MPVGNEHPPEGSGTSFYRRVLVGHGPTLQHEFNRRVGPCPTKWRLSKYHSPQRAEKQLWGGFTRTPGWGGRLQGLLGFFHGHGDTLSTTDTEGCQAFLAVAPLHFMQQGYQHPAA